MRCSKLCTRDSNPDGKVPVGSPDKKQVSAVTPQRSCRHYLGLACNTNWTGSNRKESVPGTSLSGEPPRQYKGAFPAHRPRTTAQRPVTRRLSTAQRLRKWKSGGKKALQEMQIIIMGLNISMGKVVLCNQNFPPPSHCFCRIHLWRPPCHQHHPLPGKMQIIRFRQQTFGVCLCIHI